MQRLKIVITKVEGHLKNNVNLTQEEINRIAQLKENEIERLAELEKEAELDQENALNYSILGTA